MKKFPKSEASFYYLLQDPAYNLQTAHSIKEIEDRVRLRGETGYSIIVPWRGRTDFELFDGKFCRVSVQ